MCCILNEVFGSSTVRAEVGLFNSLQVFPGNYGITTTYLNDTVPIRTAYIRVHPLTYNGYPSLRLELIVCKGRNNSFI